MEGLTNIGVIKDIAERHGFSFSKALGQNFLINPSVCPRIAEMGNAAPGYGILEIGTGFGVLTNELAKRADRVTAVEIDKRLIPVLEETVGEYGNVNIINADILKTDVKQLIEDNFKGLKTAVCANLPYYITSPVIMKLLEEKLPIESVTVMVQKEAGERLCAETGTRQCGAVTYAVRYYAEPEMLFNVSRGSFMPSPNVDSCVIRLNIRKEPPVLVTDEKFFFKTVRGAFSARRKTAVNSLSSALGIDKTAVSSAFEAENISCNIRPEQMTIEDMAKISERLLIIDNW